MNPPGSAQPDELTTRLRLLSQELASRSPIEWDSQSIVDFATRSIPGALHASLTLVANESSRPRNLASSDDVSHLVDNIQFDTGEGPCLTALDDDAAVRVNDLTQDTRWPAFTMRATAETPVRSVFSVRLTMAGRGRASLNCFAEDQSAFAALDDGSGALLSTFVGFSLDGVLERERTANLETALASSRQIGIAIGILMSSRLCTADAAFVDLRDASQRLHRKLRDVADEVARTGALPEQPVDRDG